MTIIPNDQAIRNILAAIKPDESPHINDLLRRYEAAFTAIGEVVKELDPNRFTRTGHYDIEGHPVPENYKGPPTLTVEERLIRLEEWAFSTVRVVGADENGNRV